MGETGNPISVADRIIGIYRYTGTAAVTCHRLTLSLDGQFAFDDWLDMKGRWRQAASGPYVVEDASVRLLAQRPVFHQAIKGRLAIGEVAGVVILVPPGREARFEQLQAEWDRRLAEAAGSALAECRDVFIKDPLPRVAVCGEPDVYGHALTRGRRYLVLEERDDRSSLRLFGDHGRLRWFPAGCFHLAGDPPPPA